MARRVNWGWPRALLARLELGGKVVTGDALYCQRELSLRVTGRGLLLGAEGQPARGTSPR